MTLLQQHTIETAPEGSQAILKGAQSQLGFVPNLYATFAESPALLSAYTTIGGLLDKSGLSATEQQVVLMTNNRLNGCTYCQAAHTTISQGQGIDADVIRALRNGSALSGPKLEALRRFAVIINETRGHPTDAELKAFTDAGYTAQTVLEVILGTALKVLSNYTNHIADTPLDAAFAANAWTPAPAVAA